MKTLFQQINILLEKQLSTAEVFYYAAFLHLRFVHIHPFFDGNGRSARLLEKWFLTAKLGADFWKIPSERFYKNQQATYYANLNLGVNFYALDYDRSLPFLEMLPSCLKNE